MCSADVNKSVGLVLGLSTSECATDNVSSYSTRRAVAGICGHCMSAEAGIICSGNAHGPNRTLQAPQIPSCVKGSFTLSKHQEDHVALGFSKGRGQPAQIEPAPRLDGAL